MVTKHLQDSAVEFQLDCKILQEELLSYEVAVIQLVTSCHKHRMTTGVITLWRIHVTSLATSVSTM